MREAPIAAGPLEATVRPRLLPDENRRWGLPDGWVGSAPREEGLKAMCDHGAKRFNEGYCDLVNFDCMPSEVQTIKDYMGANYPGVAIAFGSARRTLELSIAEWEKKQRPNAELRGARQLAGAASRSNAELGEEG